MPTILKYDGERGKLQRLQQEVLKLKEQVVALAEETAHLQRQKSKLEQELVETQRNRTDTVEEEDLDEFEVVNRYLLVIKVFPAKRMCYFFSIFFFLLDQANF